MIAKPCLLDTDILSYILKQQEPVYHISQEYLQQYGEFSISCMTYYECLRGYKASGATKRLEDFYHLLILTDVRYLDRAIMGTASDIYSMLKREGTLPGELDIFIAATALESDYILVTNNEKHYRPIQEYFPLTLQNWMTEQVSFVPSEEEAIEKEPPEEKPPLPEELSIDTVES